MSAFYHVSSGRAYGPSEPGESLRDYKARATGRVTHDSVIVADPGASGRLNVERI